MRSGRILAVDYGTRNIGLACSDELRLIVRPLPSVRLGGRRDLIAKLRAIVRENEIREVVIGMPLNMNGTAGDAVRQVERFAEALEGTLGLPLSRVDERLSTIEAMDIWKEMSPRRRLKYRTVDSLSAALILERYLGEN